MRNKVEKTLSNISFMTDTELLLFILESTRSYLLGVLDLIRCDGTKSSVFISGLSI